MAEITRDCTGKSQILRGGTWVHLLRSRWSGQVTERHDDPYTQTRGKRTYIPATDCLTGAVNQPLSGGARTVGGTSDGTSRRDWWRQQTHY